ncbi:LuxR C-terminal-related transcriptional regulator [Lysinibacillus sp. BW-2-10]|uniref:LuxR C-terminal-related transcriptional regulator n=1 Tax=Lysinibacillus sp. BW-2-10 TaxID=2590030 RepID=UPI001180C7C8|nr:LuxR C-terminal-related transcriptional regulator [Lysinibacillus sp. BW-2-10]TSI02647.1 hypothetical protein FJQ64_18870 [Lysinibacillus sp. BW-2-10]
MMNIMKAIVDLIDTYSTNLGLPIRLINLAGEEKIVSSENSGTILMGDVRKILEIGRTSKEPHIVTLGEEGQMTNYIISSPIHSEESNGYFLVGGPFQKGIFHIKDEEKLTIVHKMELLTVTISILIRELDNDAYRERKAMIEKDFSSLSDEIDSVLNKTMCLNKLDFIGYAKKEQDHFSIQSTFGQRVDVLLNQTFFIGEGLLGQAVALGKQVYWNSTMKDRRAEFLNKYHLFPHHLICSPIEIDGEVTGLVFGGRFSETPISNEILYVQKRLSFFLAEREKVQMVLKNANRLTNNLQMLMDTLEIFVHSKDVKGLSNKVIHSYHRLSENSFVVFTLNGECTHRGLYDEHTFIAHQKFVKGSTEYTFHRSSERLVHQRIEWDNVRYGALTIKFPFDLTQEEKTALDFVCKLISIKYMLTNWKLQEPILVESNPDHEEIALYEIDKITDLHKVIEQLPITKREQEILDLILEGLNNQEVASYLNISSHTVKNHITNIYRKLNVTDRVQAMVKIYRIKYDM